MWQHLDTRPDNQVMERVCAVPTVGGEALDAEHDGHNRSVYEGFIVRISTPPHALISFASVASARRGQGGRVPTRKRNNEKIYTIYYIAFNTVTKEIGSAVMFESMARVFLVKLLNRYGKVQALEKGSGKLSSKEYKQVLDFIAAEFHHTITVEALAEVVHISPSHFSRLF